MPRKKQPFSQFQRTHAPFLASTTASINFPDAILKAITDVARARHISRSQLVTDILEHDPEIAAHMALNAVSGQGAGLVAIEQGSSIGDLGDLVAIEQGSSIGDPGDLVAIEQGSSIGDPGDLVAIENTIK